MKHYLFFVLLVLSYYGSTAQLKIPRFFSDHMILQREKACGIWGWADPGSVVEVAFNQETFKVKAKKDSSWAVQLPATPAGGPYMITIGVPGKTLTLNDIYFGDVWFCGGQSNMNFRMHSILNYDEEVKDADYPLIRQLNVDQAAAEYPQKDIPKGEWIACNSQTIDYFSAVAFQFAKEVYKREKIPIGLIHASWGGAPIQAFMGPEALREFPQEVGKIKAVYPGFIQQRRVKDSLDRIQWEQNIYAASRFISPQKQLHRSASYFDDGKSWMTVQVPGFVEHQDIKVKKGISWYKKTIQVGPALIKDAVVMDLGRINFACAAFLNGQYVGSQLNPYYNASFKVPGNLLKRGENEIIICVYNESDNTGFRPISKPVLKAGAEVLPLGGAWQYRQGKTFDTTGAMGPMTAVDFVNSYPTLAYNGMIYPLQNFAIKGFLWYQGEGNTSVGDCLNYERMITNLIKSWRYAWKDDRLPFLMVQISSYGQITKVPKASGWAIVREAQSNVAHKLKNTGIAITNDVGNPIDVHPTNKQAVGKRLAAVALKQVYGHKDMVAYGPEFSKMEIKGSQVILSFSNLGSGLISKAGTDSLSSFAVAGADHKFYRADALISGDKVIVSSPKVPNPLHVRYAFESCPPVVDFYNKEGFPAIPFRTDQLQDFMVN